MYKIQMTAHMGWADLKTCENDSDVYYTSIFATKEDAESELYDILDGCDGGLDSWRIVSADIPEDSDIYE